MNIGFGYDIVNMEEMKGTLTGQFVSNSFTKDQFGAGFEFQYKESLTLRAGYMWEQGVLGSETITTAYTGPAAGLSVNVPAGQDGGKIGLDYSYRTTNPFGGNHCIGVHISI